VRDAAADQDHEWDGADARCGLRSARRGDRALAGGDGGLLRAIIVGAELADFLGVGGGDDYLVSPRSRREIVEFDLAGVFFAGGTDEQFPITRADGGDAGLGAAKQERLVR
jgi:hypothetical protein